VGGSISFSGLFYGVWHRVAWPCLLGISLLGENERRLNARRAALNVLCRRAIMKDEVAGDVRADGCCGDD